MSVEHRVIGPPGTGKTSYLSRQCLTASEKYGGSAIAIASLTRAAAREIASRSTGVPPANIGTLHAHAYRRLDRPALCETTEGVKEWNAACGVGGWKLSNRSVANPENAGPDDNRLDDGGDALLQEIGVLRARMIDEQLWPQRLQGFWRRWCEWKTSTGRLDFTDLIEQAVETVESLDAQIIMLDEAQDMSQLEMELARKWGEQAEQIVIVGDPDQNLYEWRGSDPDAFFNADAATTRTLAQSYRVPRAVHAAAVEWIEQIPGRASVEYKPRDEDGLLQHHQALSYKDGEALQKMLEKLMEDGSTVMMLASCGYMLHPVINVLKAQAIPFHNPYRAHGGWNPLGRVDRLLAYLRPNREAWGEQARVWTWEEIHQWTEHLQAKGVMKHGAKTRFKGKTATRNRFDDPAERQAPIHEVLGEFETQHQHPIFDTDIHWWLEHLTHSHKQRWHYPCQVAIRRGPAILRETPQLTIGSIHSVKGGEADKVVLAPDLSRAGWEEWASINRRNSIRRLFYVGMTRARNELHIIGPGGPDHVQLI